MRLLPCLLGVMLAVGGCAEGQYVDDDSGDPGEGIVEKDTKVVEELPEKTDAGDPGSDVVADDVVATPDGGEVDAAVPMDAGDDRPTELDAGGMDVVVDTGITDTGIIDTGIIDTGPRDTGPVDTGPVDTGPRDTGPVDTGPVDAGVPSILCPLPIIPIPVTCRGQNGRNPCCGPLGVCWCAEPTPFGALCVPCN